MGSSSSGRSTHASALSDAFFDAASSAALLSSLLSSSPSKVVVELVKVCCELLQNSSPVFNCFFQFAPLCSRWLFCCQHYFIHLIRLYYYSKFNNIFLSLKYSIRTIRKAMKDVNFNKVSLLAYLPHYSTLCLSQVSFYTQLAHSHIFHSSKQSLKWIFHRVLSEQHDLGI